MDEPLRIRGAVILTSLAYIDHRWGVPGRERVLARMRPAQTALLTAVHPDRWYDLDLLLALLQWVHRELAADDAFAREMGRFACDYGIHRFYRFLLRVTPIPRIVRLAPAVWASFHRPGRMLIVEMAPNRAVLRVEDYPHRSALFCARMIGWMERIIERSGARMCTIHHPVCVARMGLYCEYTGAWV